MPLRLMTEQQTAVEHSYSYKNTPGQPLVNRCTSQLLTALFWALFSKGKIMGTKQMIDSLLEGIQPMTGEILEADHFILSSSGKKTLLLLRALIGEQTHRAITQKKALIKGLEIEEPVENKPVLKAKVEVAKPAPIKERKPTPARHGSPWTKEEENKLLNFFYSDASMAEMIEYHQRSEGSLCGRLVQLGVLEYCKDTGKYMLVQTDIQEAV